MIQFRIIILVFVLGYTTIPDCLAQSRKYLFSIGEDQHFAGEFNYAYSKNNQKKQIKKDSINAYLELYINFRLKVKEAKALGYDTTFTFKQEYELYKGQLEDSYLSPKKEKEALIKEAYERSLWEVKASHILIKVSEDVNPDDSLEAYNKIIEIRNRILKGEDFAELAKSKSDDPSAKNNGGDLGYFSVFQMVYPFETAAYTTAVGEVSKPIRTQFGYHIIKVQDKRTNKGKVEVAHIMIKSTSKNGEEFQLAAKKKAFRIDSLLQLGGNWNELCKTYSEDLNSATQNGLLKPFGRGQIVLEFEEIAFSLTDVNEISNPVKTQFGWHIIKLIRKIPVGTYDQEKSVLARRIKSDIRSSMPRSEMLKVLKEENKFYKNGIVASKILKLPPSVIIKNKWQFDSLQLSDSSSLFIIGDINITTGQFLSSFNQTSLKMGAKQKAEMGLHLLNFEDSLIISYEKSRLPSKYPEYSYLIHEYYDGILLFSIMEDSVWNNSMKDSVGLNSYYELNKEKYATQAMDTSIFSSDSKSILENIRSDSPSVLNGIEWETLNSKLLKENNVSPLTLHVISKSGNEWDKLISFYKNTMHELFEMNNKWYWMRRVEVTSYIPLKEIKGKVISDYQSYLDRKWIDELRKKYPVKINKKQLNKVYTHFEAFN